MLMGLPTIAYETTATIEINKDSKCLLTAKMENVDDLAQNMLFALEHPTEVNNIALEGKKYADANYSNDSVCKELIDAAIAMYDHFHSKCQISKEFIFNPREQ